MRLSPHLIVLALAISAVQPVEAEEVCGIDWESADRLFQAIDPGHSEAMMRASAEWRNGDVEQACQLVVETLRNEVVDLDLDRRWAWNSYDAAEVADILDDVIAQFGDRARVPRLANGQLDWRFGGTTFDKSWSAFWNRHLHLRKLLLIYRDDPDQRYIDRIEADLLDWISSNPYTGEKTKQPNMSWVSLEPPLRVFTWAQIFSELAPKGFLQDSTLLLLVSSITDHAHFLRNHHSRRDNHVLLEMTGLAVIAKQWPFLAGSDEWIDYSDGVINQWSEDHFYPDGSYVELSAFYHAYALKWMLEYREVIDSPGADVLEQMVTAGWEYLSGVLRPDGTVPLNNDGDRVDFGAQAMHAAQVSQRPDWTCAWDESIDRCPATELYFPWAGHLVSRNRWAEDADWSFFDVGPAGTGSHRHNDRLHLSIAIAGQDILVDNGRFSYQRPDPWRDYFQGWEAHNLMTLSGWEPVLPAPRAKRAIPESDYLVTPELSFARGRSVLRRGEERAAAHRSLLHVEKKYWLIVDEYRGASTERLETLWHFHPSVAVEFVDGMIRARRKDGIGIDLIPLRHEWSFEKITGQGEPDIQGWWSPFFKKRLEAPAVIASADVQPNDPEVWLVVPRDPAREQEWRADVRADEQRALVVEVTLAERSWIVDIPRQDEHPKVESR